jgi:hypothetical protein
VKLIIDGGFHAALTAGPVDSPVSRDRVTGRDDVPQ